MACLAVGAVLVSFAFVAVGAVRGEDEIDLTSMALEVDGGIPDNSQQATIPYLEVLQYNMCWECMSAWDDGSGKYASKHCTPGKIVGTEFGAFTWEPLDADVAAKFRLPPRLRSEAQLKDIFEAAAFERYATSCTWNMLKNLKNWHTARRFNFVSMSELCSPGKDGVFVKGFEAEPGLIAANYSKRQCSPLIFDIMDQEVFPDLEAVVHAVPTRFGPVTQLTWYPKTTLGEPLIVKTDMAVGRPITALVWESTKLMFINLHAIHFRKNLITAATCGDIPDMCVYINSKVDDVSKQKHDGPFSEQFSLSKLSTADLSSWFGEFVTLRIAQHLPKLCGNSLPCTLPGWRIIVGGDFNDETGELFDLNLFGLRVYLDNGQRKRTCCSDRDEYWLFAYKKPADEFTGYAGGAVSTYTHTDQNWEYLLQTCKYEGKCMEVNTTCKNLFNAEAPNAIITDINAGAPRPTGGIGPSRYPFASDLILDSEPVVSFSFPMGYEQTVEEAYSDHDPVVAVLQPLGR